MIVDLQHQLGIDSSFFWQFLLFSCVFLIMRAAFFAPYLTLIQSRENQSGGLSDEARRLEEEAVRLNSQYQNSLSAARKRMQLERDALLTDARKEAAGLVFSAREKSKARIEKSRETAAQSAEAELGELKSQVASVAELLVNKLTHTKVGI